MAEDFLSFECVRCQSPKVMWGDLHVVPEGIFFLNFECLNPLANTLLALLPIPIGPLILLMMGWGKRRIRARMGHWRSRHAGQPLDQLVEVWPDSWSVTPEEIVLIRKGLGGLVIRRAEGGMLVLEVEKSCGKEIKTFAQAQGWPVK